APEALPSHRQVLTIGYGQNGTLACSVDANPKPNVYTWSKNGHFIATTTEDTLLIRGEKDSDGGIFGCQAENPVGRSSIIETHVIIAEPPAFITRPPAELRVFEGAPVDVTCEGFGDPLPIVYWRRISSASLSFPSASHSDHGIYDCVVSNAVSTISTSMSLIVERTRPQAAVIDKVECVGDEAIAIQWTPGFNGSYPQSFVIHYVSEEDSSEKTLLTTSTSATIGDLIAFSKYRILIESRNQKGSTNSSAVEKYVCSTLPAPSNVHLVGESELRWDPVEQLDRIASSHGEVLDPFFRMRPDFRNGQSFRIRSLRPPYEPSLPSRSVDLGSIVCPSSFQPHTETLYEPSVNLSDNAKCKQWQGSRADSELQEQSQDMLDYCYAEESTSAVDDMLREKYMYGAEDVPVQLMNDLRIERLRREFKQSQL
ncbi:immunoglobulin domain protein, partial [Ostertagia ostertagi]